VVHDLFYIPAGVVERLEGSVSSDPKAIEELAPDQATLSAAIGLAKPGKWSRLGASPDGALIWGECAGPAALPYVVMADLRDLGNVCSCSSRELPCKHALALLRIHAEGAIPFPPAETPGWAGTWLTRRRDGIATHGTFFPDDDERAVQIQARMDKDTVRSAAEAARRAEDTERAILDALDQLEQWIGDQLRIGLPAFIADTTARCRRIAVRLVDGQAAELANRIDELPARLLALPAGDQLSAAVIELGRLVLLARAFRAAPGDADIQRAVASSYTWQMYGAVTSDPTARRVRAVWEVLTERERRRRDGLVSYTTWLLNLDTAGPRFAMLLHNSPVSLGGRSYTSGERFVGELAFYPGRNPLRAERIEWQPIEDARESDWPEPKAAFTETLAERLLAEPWALDVPVLLPAGRLAIDAAGRSWWRSHDGAVALPLADGATGLMRGTELTSAAALWSGNQLEILAARTPWGRIEGGHG
jgi:hypothetical protein